jgi:hypothetical protein
MDSRIRTDYITQTKALGSNNLLTGIFEQNILVTGIFSKIFSLWCNNRLRTRRKKSIRRVQIDRKRRPLNPYSPRLTDNPDLRGPTPTKSPPIWGRKTRRRWTAGEIPIKKLSRRISEDGLGLPNQPVDLVLAVSSARSVSLLLRILFFCSRRGGSSERGWAVDAGVILGVAYISASPSRFRNRVPATSVWRFVWVVISHCDEFRVNAHSSMPLGPAR